MNTDNPFEALRADVDEDIDRSELISKGLLTSFRGRIPRRTFWAAMIVLNFVVVLAQQLVLTLGRPPEGEPTSLLVPVVFLAILGVASWIGLVVTVKRWHDRGKSGWWILIGLVPLIGPFWAFIETACLRGTKGPNRYGPDPT